MSGIEQLERYPGGELRGVNVQDGGYALWTPHRGFRLELTGEIGDPPSQQYAVMKSALYGDHMFSTDQELRGFKYGEFINRALRTPLYERGHDVSQLTKLASSATIPNTQDFFRSQTLELTHLYATVIGRANHIELSEDDIHEQTANQLLEDLMHYLLSHGLEIHFQGWNSQQLMSTTMGGLVIPAAMPELMDTPYLRSLDMQTGSFRLTKEYDFISAKKEHGKPPGIDFDKLHYTPTEGALWFADYDDPKIHDLLLAISDPNAVDITSDGYLYFKDPEVALGFSKLYLLLTTEHWNDVMQRLQIFAGNQAFSLAIVKRILRSMKSDDGHPIDSGVTMNPESYAYGIDSDLDMALQEMVQEGDEYANVLQELLKTVGMQERGRFINNKRRVYAEFLKDPHATEYPNATGVLGKKDGYNRDFGPPSPMFDIKVLKRRPSSKLPRGVMPVLTDKSSRFVLDTLKVRSVDPLVRHRGKIIRLSECMPRYQKILEQHEVIHSAPVSVDIMLNPDYTRVLKRGYESTKIDFDQLMTREQLGPDKMRQLILGSAKRAKAVASSRGVLVERNRR